MIERHTIFELEVTVDNFETIVRDGISGGITGIHIRCGQRADCGALGILIDSEVVQSDISWRFVYIAHRNLECLRSRKAPRVRCRDRHRDRICFFVIERDTIF